MYILVVTTCPNCKMPLGALTDLISLVNPTKDGRIVLWSGCIYCDPANTYQFGGKSK